MTSSNKFRLIRARESQLGVAPVNGFSRSWVMDWGLKPEEQFEQSQTITGDRLIAELLRVGARVSGAMPFEWYFGGQDWAFELGFLNTYSNVPRAAGTQVVGSTAGTDVIATNNGAVFTTGDLVRVSGWPGVNGEYVAVAGSGANALKIGAGGTLPTDNAPPATAVVQVVGVRGAAGDIQANAAGLVSTALNWAARPWITAGRGVKIGGASTGPAGNRFATGALNKFATILPGVTATALPLDDKGASWATDNGASKTITIYIGDVLDIGDVATMPTETHEGVLLGQATPVHMNYGAIAAGSLTMALTRRAPIRPSLALQGFVDGYSTAGPLDDAFTTPTFEQPMVTGSDVGEILVGGAARAGHSVVKEMNLTLENNLQSDGPLNNFRDVVYDAGDAILRCGLRAKFGGTADWAPFRSGAQTSFQLPFYKPNRGYLMKLWAGKYTDGDASPGGRNGFVDFRGTIQGFKDPVTGKMLTLTRFPYLEI